MRWVRPIISIAMAGTVIWGFIVRLIPWTAFSPIAVGAIGWWYYQRDKEKKNGGGTTPANGSATTTTPLAK